LSRWSLAARDLAFGDDAFHPRGAPSENSIVSGTRKCPYRVVRRRFVNRRAFGVSMLCGCCMGLFTNTSLFQNTVFEVGYRYTAADDLDFTARDGSSSSTDFPSNSVTLGFRKNFWNMNGLRVDRESRRGAGHRSGTSDNASLMTFSLSAAST